MKKLKIKILTGAMLLCLGLNSVPAFAYSTYYRDDAVNYANDYAESPNSDYHNYIDEGGDCTNFVSQCLYAGGIPDTGTWGPSTGAWRDANLFRKYFMNNDAGYRSYTVKMATDDFDTIYSLLWPGDIVQYGHSISSTTHSQIVTGYDSSDRTITIAQHSDTWSGFYKDQDLLSYLYGRASTDRIFIHKIKSGE